MAQNYVPYQVPDDVDERVKRFQQRIAAKRGVEVHRVSKSGDALRYVLAMAEAAEQLHIVPVQAQP